MHNGTHFTVFKETTHGPSLHKNSIHLASWCPSFSEKNLNWNLKLETLLSHSLSLTPSHYFLFSDEMSTQLIHLLSPSFPSSRSLSNLPASSRLLSINPIYLPFSLRRHAFPLSCSCSSSHTPLLSSDNGFGSNLVVTQATSSAIDVDAVTEAELKENGFRWGD